MYKRDFIARMIEMMAELIAGILGLIKKGKFEKAQEQISNAYNDMLENDVAFFQNIPLDKLADTLLSEHNYTKGHLEILAELFFAQAELYYAQEKQADSLVYYQKSLFLHQFVIKESQLFSMEVERKLASLDKRIGELKNVN